ncbi:MAG: ABC transporter permease [Planctomycetales bacterium]|nr:ABC transporter permease [Planctomycetales bacterium]
MSSSYPSGQLAIASPWRVAFQLAKREIVRFFRQKNRVVGAVGQPVLFWLLFGTGLNQSFQMQGQSFSEYYVPGTIVLILLFTAIFSTISIIEDRNEGFLQSVLVAPIPTWSMVLGKVLGGTLIALIQAILFLALSLLLVSQISVVGIALSIVYMTLIAIGLTCLGFVLAWKLDSTQGFHAIMSVLLMPMWLLSGAFFPIPDVQTQLTMGEKILRIVMLLNPTTYAVAGLRRVFIEQSNAWMPSVTLCWTVTILFGSIMFAAATAIARTRTAGDLK